MLLRFACACACGVLLAGCALFEPETSPRAAVAPRSRIALKADPTGPIAPAQVKTDGAYRAAQKAPARNSEPGSCDTPSQCEALLRDLVNDPSRRWIAQRPSLVVYANGTRPFAYMALRAKLSCHELRLAVDELLAVTASLNANDARLTPDQITRVRTLNAQVIVELRQEQNDRCGLANPTG